MPRGASCGRLLRDGHELPTQIVLELGVTLCRDERAILPAGHAGGDVVGAGTAAEAVIHVAVHFVRPAHVPWELTAGDDVMADHGVGGHVSYIGVWEPHPPLSH